MPRSPKQEKGARHIEISTPEDDAPREPAAEEAGPITDASGIEHELAEAEQESAEELRRLQSMIEEMEQKCVVAEDEKARVAAELHNYKRRVQQEKELLTRYANEGLVLELIPVMDNFERAMEVPVESADGKSLMAGVQMIYSQLQAALEGNGVRQISAKGQDFDPNLHEAVERVESDEHPPNTVVGELAKGYQMGDRLIRPARVRVTVAPAE